MVANLLKKQSLNYDRAADYGFYNRMVLAVDVEFAHGVFQMENHRFLGNSHDHGNLIGSLSLSGPQQALFFPRRQRPDWVCLIRQHLFHDLVVKIQRQQVQIKTDDGVFRQLM